jgi:hypothetical protein
MKNTISISISLATISLALGYAQGSLWPGAGLIVVLGLLWLGGQQLQTHWLPNLGFVALVGAAAYGIWQELSVVWMLLGIVTALVPWDLVHFSQRLRQVGHISGEAQLKRDHLRRLLPVAGAGLALAGVALSFQFELSLGWAMILGLLVVIGLGRVIRRNQLKSGQ